MVVFECYTFQYLITAGAVIKGDYVRVHNYPVAIVFPGGWHQLLKYDTAELKEHIRITGKCDWVMVFLGEVSAHRFLF